MGELVLYRSVIKHSTTGCYLPVRRPVPQEQPLQSPMGCMPDISASDTVGESVLIPSGATEAPSCGTERSVPRAVEVRCSL